VDQSSRIIRHGIGELPHVVENVCSLNINRKEAMPHQPSIAISTTEI
jgi:hypothetical protein